MDSDDGITSSDSGDDQPAPDNDDCVSSAITWPDLPVNIPADDDSLDDIIDAISPAGLDVLINDRPSTVDDWIDRVSHRLTVLLLVGSALVAGSKQFFEDPVHCWIPGSVDADYANRYCWVRGTYYLPHDEHVPSEYDTTTPRMYVNYYQWVPFVLLVEAVMFYLPYSLWNTLSTHSGIDLHSLYESGRSCMTDTVAQRELLLRGMTSQLDRYLRRFDPPNVADCEETRCSMRIKNCNHICHRGNYLFCLYTFTKLLYLVNAICQLFLLNVFLGGSMFHAYGIDVLRGAVDLHSDWPTVSATRFPRVTMCDLKIRRLGNVHRYVLQCVLPINMLNEKIFLFFWFWFVIVASVTFVSLVTWTVQVAIPSNGMLFVTQHLRFAGKFGDVIEHKAELRHFVDHYLRRDGLAVMFLMTRNTNTLATTEFMASLWDNYFKRKTE